jgi:hypothetical protein
VEVKIGIQQSPREVAFESDVEPDKLAETITKAWSANELVVLEDNKGRKILVPTEKITFVELGASNHGRVGFGG